MKLVKEKAEKLRAALSKLAVKGGMRIFTIDGREVKEEVVGGGAGVEETRRKLVPSSQEEFSHLFKFMDSLCSHCSAAGIFDFIFTSLTSISQMTTIWQLCSTALRSLPAP